MNEITRSSIASGFLDLPRRPGLGQGIKSGFGIIGIKSRVWSLRYQGETYYFTREEDGTPLPYIDVVILEENPNVSKTYYPGSYTEDSNNAPTCAAVNGDVPDPGVPIPQSPTCPSCSHNVWKTMSTGRQGQECKDNKRVAVLLMPALTEKMLGAPLQEPVMLRIPGDSLRPFKSYGDGLEHRGVDPAWVVTRISFDRAEQFRMKFETKQPLTNAEVPVIKKLLDSPLISTIIGKQTPVYAAGTQLPPKREQRVETGILGAFGQEQQPPVNNQGQVTTMKPRGGRPLGNVNRPKPVEIEAQAEEQVHEATTKEQDAAAVDVPYDEADPQLDETLQKVVDQKIHGMLKK